MLLKTRKSLQKTDSAKPGAGHGTIAASSGLFGALLSLFGMLGIVSSFVYMVPTQQIGIPVSFGAPGNPVKNGLHVKALWVSVKNMDGTVQIDDNLGDRRSEIRLGNQSVGVSLVLGLLGVPWGILGIPVVCLGEVGLVAAGISPYRKVSSKTCLICVPRCIVCCL